MRLFSIIIIFILTAPQGVFSQNENWLATKLRNADTVLLVSHDATAGVAIVDSAGNRVPLPDLIINGRPNYSIIREQHVLSGALLDTFIRILARPFTNGIVEMSKCFIPHHAVFIIKNGKTSFVDLCFSCQRFETSGDLARLNAFDNRKWNELESYFLKLGFRFQLTE